MSVSKILLTEDEGVVRAADDLETDPALIVAAAPPDADEPPELEDMGDLEEEPSSFLDIPDVGESLEETPPPEEDSQDIRENPQVSTELEQFAETTRKYNAFKAFLAQNPDKVKAIEKSKLQDFMKSEQPKPETVVINREFFEDDISDEKLFSLYKNYVFYVEKLSDLETFKETLIFSEVFISIATVGDFAGEIGIEFPEYDLKGRTVYYNVDMEYLPQFHRISKNIKVNSGVTIRLIASYDRINFSITHGHEFDFEISKIVVASGTYGKNCLSALETFSSGSYKKIGLVEMVIDASDIDKTKPRKPFTIDKVQRLHLEVKLPLIYDINFIYSTLYNHFENVEELDVKVDSPHVGELKSFKDKKGDIFKRQMRGLKVVKFKIDKKLEGTILGAGFLNLVRETQSLTLCSLDEYQDLMRDLHNCSFTYLNELKINKTNITPMRGNFNPLQRAFNAGYYFISDKWRRKK